MLIFSNFYSLLVSEEIVPRLLGLKLIYLQRSLSSPLANLLGEWLVERLIACDALPVVVRRRRSPAPASGQRSIRGKDCDSM